MSMPEENWWSVRAGEYVMGTLRGEDLRLFEKILASDTQMQRTVAQWEKSLAGLNESTAAQSPGEHVWPEILSKVRLLDKQGTSSDADQIVTTSGLVKQVANTEDNIPTAANKTEPKSESIFWQTLAGLATAASLILGMLLTQSTLEPASYPLNVDGVAVVLSDDSGTPYFLVETDYGSLTVRVTALSPPSLDESRDFQLWQALPDRSAVKPVALLPERAGDARTFNVNSLVKGSDLFGVSIEPVGAATDDGPTGPVVGHGDYLPTQILD